MVNNNYNHDYKKGKKSEVMHNKFIHHLVNDARPLFPNPDWPPFLVTPLSLYTEHEVLGCGIILWSVQVTHPSFACPQLLL